MKKQLLTGLIICISTTLLNAQTPVERLDTILNEEYDGSQWVYDDLEVFTYDSAGNVSIVEYYEWSGTAWAASYKEDYAYTASQQVSERIESNWGTSTNSWEPSQKRSYTYNSSGNLLSEINYSRNPGSWQESYKEEYTYNPEGNPTVRMDYYWDGTQWAEDRKREFTYNTAGQLTNEDEYSWDGSAWSPVEKRELTYHSSGELAEFLYYYWNNGTWEGEAKETYDYNSNGKITTFTSYDWDATAGDWGLQDEQALYTYDANGNTQKILYAEWDATNNSWAPYGQYMIEMDQSVDFSDLLFGSEDYIEEDEPTAMVFFNKPLTLTFSEYDGSWTDMDRETFIYNAAEAVGISENISHLPMKVFPNPAATYLQFDLPATISRANVSIYDIKGDVILTQTLAPNQRVPVQGMSPGTYLYRVSAGGKEYGGKVVVR